VFNFENFKNAIVYGSAMASFCVEDFGPRKLIELTEDEIRDRIGNFIDLVQFDISLTCANLQPSKQESPPLIFRIEAPDAQIAGALFWGLLHNLTPWITNTKLPRG
jgi:hypothetical protein